ncbi:unnamed protein product [Pylaiella littoralis]
MAHPFDRGKPFGVVFAWRMLEARGCFGGLWASEDREQLIAAATGRLLGCQTRLRHGYFLLFWFQIFGMTIKRGVFLIEPCVTLSCPWREHLFVCFSVRCKTYGCLFGKFVQRIHLAFMYGMQHTVTCERSSRSPSCGWMLNLC